MTRQPLTKAEREELRRLNDAASPAPWFVFKMDGYPNVVSYTVPHNGETLRGEIPADDADDELIAAARNALPRLLADLDAAEAERDALRKIAEGCCNATDGGCSPGVSIEFLRDVPSEVEHIKRERDRLRKMPQSAFEAATFRELNAMEAQRDRAESELDAERRMRVEAEAASDRLMAERDALKAMLADAERDRDSFRESFVRVLDAVGCGNIFVSDEALVAGVREKIAELDATKARLAELLSHHQGQHAELQSILGSDDALAVLASRAVSDLAATKEKLADAERFASDLADDRRKLNSIRDDLCLVGKEMTELRKERDDAKAKLAAVVEEVNAAVDHVDHENYPLCGVYDGTKASDCTCGVLRIRTAIEAAAHGGAS